jgi:UDP-N-acetylmuramate--alanine ligase
MHIYFSGIGGVAIGPLALICRDAGYTVSGSDLTESRFTKLMQQAGLEVTIGQDGSHIASMHQKQPVDWLVISSALPADHPEIAFAHQNGIKVTKRADMINAVLQNTRLKMVAITGTHGKTTTTAMVVWLFKQFNLPVSYSIGTSFSFGPSGAYQTGSEYFVYECDEYDRNMLAFAPSLSAITVVDYDHSDTYPTRADYDKAFIEFAGQSGRLIMWYADATRLNLEGRCTQVLDAAEPRISRIKLPGQHNRANAWQAAKTFIELFPDKNLDEVIAALERFPGTDRRFERLAPNLYTDYAHHPAEIRATLQLASELNDVVIAVYQPHQNLRQHQLAHEYGNCFNQAARAYWLPTYLSREDPNLPVLTPAELIAHLDTPGVAEPAEMDDALLAKLSSHLQEGELVVCLGAGTLDEWVRKHMGQLDRGQS